LELLILAVKLADIATFLGRKLHGNFQGGVESHLNCVRHLGTRIKHTLGRVALKMYDKFGVVLRVETTVNDVSFFWNATGISLSSFKKYSSTRKPN
jgi:hypothetical protein